MYQVNVHSKNPDEKISSIQRLGHFSSLSDPKKTISWNASKNVMVSSRKSKSYREKKTFEVSVVQQCAHRALKIWKKYILGKAKISLGTNNKIPNFQQISVQTSNFLNIKLWPKIELRKCRTSQKTEQFTNIELFVSRLAKINIFWNSLKWKDS